jgi:outer membrane protein insertion porin family
VENQRVRVKDILFVGNTAYGDGELKWIIQTKEYIPIFRTGEFDPEQAARDAAMVQKYYRDRGYLDAEVGYTIEFQDVAREDLELTFRVNEGTRYEIGELRIEGNEVFSDEEIEAEMDLEQGDFLIDSRLQMDKKNVRQLYGSQGYIYANVSSSWVFSSAPGEIILTISVQEGEQFSVGDIRVRGNEQTHEKVVRRELRFYPLETFDTKEMRKAEKRLKGTGLFTEANIEPVGDEPGMRDALVTVEENPQTTQFIAGVGASSNSGVVGNIVLENTNFDLFDTPRSFEEFFKGQSFRGAGQTMRISLEPGTELSRFRIDFREPYLMDKPIGFGTSLYLFERGRDGYDEERTGGNFSFDRRFEEGWLEGWAGEIAFRAENVEVNDREAWAAEDIRDVDGSNYLSTVKLSLLHDTTDSRYEPTEGHRMRLSWEQAGAMGGDFYHAKVIGSYSQHWPVYEDEEGRKSVFTARGRLGQIFGNSPVFERFYAGGIGSMRGFDYRGVSPRQGIRSNRIGGEFMALAGAEYSFPLYTEAVRGVLFSDMGTVEEDFGLSSWRVSVGFGVRLTLQIFGTVPMEFDFALPVVDEEEDDTRAFSFFIGLPFF